MGEGFAMTPATRDIINRHWRLLGVDPNDEMARYIESLVQLAALQEIRDGFADLAAKMLSKPK